MSTWNAYARLLALLPETPTDVGTVTAVGSDGCTVTLLTGEETTAKGVAEVGDHVYLRDGAVIGPAPVLSSTVIEI